MADGTFDGVAVCAGGAKFGGGDVPVVCGAPVVANFGGTPELELDGTSTFVGVVDDNGTTVGGDLGVVVVSPGGAFEGCGEPAVCGATLVGAFADVAISSTLPVGGCICGCAPRFGSDGDLDGIAVTGGLGDGSVADGNDCVIVGGSDGVATCKVV